MSATPPFAGAIDSFSIFRNAVMLRGWCHATGARITALELQPSAAAPGAPRMVSPNWLPSPDICAFLGDDARNCRFDLVVFVGPGAASMCGGAIFALCDNGARIEFARLGEYRPSAASDLIDRFIADIAALPAPNVLEIGSRARSGNTRRNWLPAAARYTGCDILPGENVDVVCDAHALGTSLPRRSFHAMFAVSVLEHLLMPWKFAIELNRVLAPGAIGLIATHQCWPMHDMPWDFWRFSDRAWTALFNKATGFEIIATGMGEPAYIVAEHCHPATNYPPEPAGFLASNVMFRKIAETRLTWNVDLTDLVDTDYPV